MFNQTVTLPLIQSKTVMLEGMPATLIVEQVVPPDAASLIWEEFFESRQRGIDWRTHLPWTKQRQALCVSAMTASGLVATLLIRCLPDVKAAMVGYVCVHKKYRGQELSRMLIELAANALASAGFCHLILWTRKPQIYENSGFDIATHEQCMSLELKPVRGDCGVQLSPWPEKRDLTVGLPPFATAGWVAQSACSSIIFVDTPDGATLLDKSGTSSSVIEIMATVRPGSWSATLEIQDDLAVHATMNSLIVSQNVGPATMVRPLAGPTAPPMKIPLIARI